MQRYDVVIVGAGHNGLTAAAYLARAGLSVLVLERLDHVGGAAVSEQAFAGHPARLSRYSYLVSLLPSRLVSDLELPIQLASRSVSSYTPYERDGVASGLLVERPEGEATRASFRALTGSDEEYDAWRAFYADVAGLAEAVAPTFLDPLPTEAVIRSAVREDVWREVVTEPLGRALERRFRNDLVRGVVATDALIGTFASLHSESLAQNRCFLYHLVGNGTGEWRVPLGGMGAVTAALETAAVQGGAEIRTGAGVHAIHAGADGAEVVWDDSDGRHGVAARFVLANVAPWVLRILFGEDGPDGDAETKPVGAQLKINMLLRRLPALRSGEDPARAFAGTLHLAESYSQLEAAHAAATAGSIPDPLPGEVYCHSLTDPSILGGEDAHTLTYFGLHTPAWLLRAPSSKERAVAAALASLDAVLAEPIMSVIAHDEAGHPCLEARTPAEIEAELAMPGGHIFHGDLDWPWAPNRADLSTPAARWGVQTDVASVLLCGSGARRGGAVSGIGGHNAAQAVLESR